MAFPLVSTARPRTRAESSRAPEPARAPKPEPEPDAYTAALHRQEEGDRAAAERLLVDVLEREPDHFDALLSLSAILIERRDLDAVPALIERALAIDPLSPEPTLVQALLLRKQAKVREALSPLRRSAFLDPEFWPASFLLATTWQRLGELDRSRHEFEHTLRVLESVDPGPAQRHLAGLSGLYIDPARALALCRSHA
jgi:predicted Zn-dependent protease